jgi:hypothetical protein
MKAHERLRKKDETLAAPKHKALQPVFAQEGYAGHTLFSAVAWLRHA